MIDRAVTEVLRAMEGAEVRCLLGGGQACVFYGAAEFSKDVNFVIAANAENFERIEAAKLALQAEPIAVPPFESRFLEEGLALHLRCNAEGCDGIRLDLMSRMRGVAAFEELWNRRKTLAIGGIKLSLLGIRDLVASKKTQRAKDWPMIQRLLEVHYFENRNHPSEDDIDFWLRELLTAELLMEAIGKFPEHVDRLQYERPLLALGRTDEAKSLRAAIAIEIEEEKERDREHWEPLKARLAELRRAARRDD